MTTLGSDVRDARSPHLPCANSILSKSYRRTLKRLLDVGVCALSAPLLLPLGLLIALVVRLDSRGPVFFVQRRTGRDGRVFPLIKFRTLHHDIDRSAHESHMQSFVRGEIDSLEGDQTTFKPFVDDQVTRVGSFLRRTSLDELPQLINVVRGDMSLVGPRPNVCYEVEAYKPWHRQRLRVLPGVTGLAQVRGRSCVCFDEIVHHDLEYIAKQSFLLDLKILWWTVVTVVVRAGAE